MGVYMGGTSITPRTQVSEPRWPEGEEDFKTTVTEYCTQMWVLTRHILKLFAMVLRQEEGFFQDKFPEGEELLLSSYLNIT